MTNRYKPAAYLLAGDIVFQLDYPVEIQHVRRCPYGSHVLLIWGDGVAEWCVVPEGHLVRYVARVDVHHI